MTDLQINDSAFNPGKQCHWCGSTDLDQTPGYAGERGCRTCGWGGDGAPDVPCMFYKLVQPIRETGDAI